MTATESAQAAQLRAMPYLSNVYIQVPGQRMLWRFTRTTNAHWKRTDGLSGVGQWVDTDQLAALGTITDPPWKETHHDRDETR